MNPKKLTLFVLTLLSLTAFPALAQSTASAIVGIVKDPAGLGIADAEILLTTESTGVARRYRSLDDGSFRLAPVDSGTYSVSVRKPGFENLTLPRIVVGVASVVRLELPLTIGDVAVSIEVKDAAPLLQTDETSVGGTITSVEMSRLPVNGRNYTRLVLLMPGTSDQNRNQEVGSFSGTGGYSVNGQRAQDNNFTLNGIENNVYAKNSPGASPPMDSLQEMRILAGGSAEFGRSAGANINMIVKSGTRDLHGSLYEYFRNDKLDANDFFANRQGTGKVPFRQNQYGASAGGPLWIPKLNEHRDRTFWFANWEGFRNRRGSTLLSNVPTEAERRGDFSQSGRTIYDPATSRLAGGAVVRDLFPGNVIPETRIHSAANYVLKAALPLPNIASAAGSNYVNLKPSSNNRDAIVARLDRILSPKDTLSGHFLWQTVDSLSPNANPNYASVSEFDANSVSAAWNRTLSPSSVLEVRFGHYHPSIPIVNGHLSAKREEFLTASGIRLFQQQTLDSVIPAFTVQGEFSLPTGAALYADRTFQFATTFSRVVHSHTWKTGAQYARRGYLYEGSNPIDGTVVFDQRLTNLATDSRSGKSTASFLLGLPSSVQRGQGTTRTNARQNVYHFFAQDDWRATRHLTVNLGLRYEIQNAPYDRDNLLGGLLLERDPQSGSYSAELLWAGVNPLPNPVTGALNSPPNRKSFGRALQASDWNNVAPRVGLAWQLRTDTVVRAGYSIFYNSTFMQELQDKRKFYPYSVSQTFTTNTDTLPDLSLSDTGPAFTNTAAIGGYPQDPGNQTPYSQQWNFFLEHQFPGENVLAAGYTGSGNRRQIGYAPFNVAPQPGPGAVQPRRLLPQYGDMYLGKNDYNSSYHGLQIKASRRFRNGVAFQANYTWARSMDEQSSLSEWKVQDPFNRRADYSRSSWDIRHVFQFSYNWDLPFGRGRRFGTHWARPLDWAFGGWALDGLTRIQTGAPVNVVLGQDRANVGTTVQRPDVIRNPNHGPRTPDAWFDTTAFTLPAAYTYGNAGAFLVDADGRNNWDVSLAKSFRMAEAHWLDLRGDFFNVANHVNMGLPGASFASTTQFGRVTGATSSRQIQLSLRCRF